MSYTGRLAVKNGVYQAVINYKENGKYKTKWISTGLKEIGNKRKAEKFLREQLESFSVIKQRIDDLSSFIDLLDNWMEVKGITLRQNSYDIYERVLTHHIKPYFESSGLSIYELEAKHFQAYFTKKSKALKHSTLDRHLVPYFKKKSLRINEVAPRHIKEYYELKFRGGRLDSKKGGLSIPTIKKHGSVLKMVFREAQIIELIDKNPAEIVPLPRQESVEKKAVFLTAKEANELAQELHGLGYENHIVKE